jgi:hypothetical protein
MRITIETTYSEPMYSIKSTVEVPYDDVTLEQVRELVDQALLGYGYLWPREGEGR